MGTKTKDKTKKRRATAYDKGQHELICKALDISPDPKAPGVTAYEGVCILMMKLAHALDGLSKVKTKEARATMKFLRKDFEDEEFSVIPLFGTSRP